MKTPHPWNELGRLVQSHSSHDQSVGSVTPSTGRPSTCPLKLTNDCTEKRALAAEHAARLFTFALVFSALSAFSAVMEFFFQTSHHFVVQLAVDCLPIKLNRSHNRVAAPQPDYGPHQSERLHNSRKVLESEGPPWVPVGAPLAKV